MVVSEESEKLIEEIISKNSDINLTYESDGNGPDYKTCPLCNATEKMIYKNGELVFSPTMSSIEHSDDCLYVLINKLSMLLY